MFTYILIAAAVVLLVAVVWHQVRTWNTPGRHIPQNAPMDDAMNDMAKLQHENHIRSQQQGGGAGL